MAPKRKKDSQKPPAPPPRPTDLIHDDQPTSVDWTKDGIIISEIRSQGEGSTFCWAYAAAGVIEDVYNKKAKEGGWRKPAKAASVQHLINCVAPDVKAKILTLGKVYRFVKRNKLAREQDLPYQGGKKFKCNPHQFNRHQAIEIVDYKETSCDTETIAEREILKLLTEHSVAVTLEDSSELVRCGREKEIYLGPKERDVQLLQDQDHALVLVGYKTTEEGINLGDLTGDIQVLERLYVNRVLGVAGLSLNPFPILRLISGETAFAFWDF